MTAVEDPSPFQRGQLQHVLHAPAALWLWQGIQMYMQLSEECTHPE